MQISPSLRMLLLINTHLVIHAQMFWVKGLAKRQLLRMSGKDTFTYFPLILFDSTAVSIFVVILVALTNTVFVNSINITTNIETAALSRFYVILSDLPPILLNSSGSTFGHILDHKCATKVLANNKSWEVSRRNNGPRFCL